MNKLKHTPGPWKMTISKSGDSCAIYSDSEKCLIVSTKRDPVVLDETWNRQLSDARLISAAPEMLDALIETIKPKHEDNNQYEDRVRRIMDIIENATGKKIEDLI